MVPKRTGRKRKRGSAGPWEGDAAMTDGDASRQDGPAQLELEDPTTLKRKLRDNVGKYEVEALGLIKHTHRYRGKGGRRGLAKAD